MTAETTWTKRIKDAARDAGTYQPFFDPIIETLAQIMERRDKALKQFEASGGKPVIAHTNKAGATNLERNPTLLIVSECEKTALQYWRDLGLTPSGLRKINEDALAPAKKRSALESVLAKLEE